MLLDLDTAKKRIAPHEEGITAAHFKAAQSWVDLSKHSELFGPLRVLTHRCWVHDHLRAALDQLVVRPGVTPTEGLDFYALYIEPDVLLRFKHIGLDGLPQNIRTQQQRRLGRQEYTEGMLENLQLSLTEPPTLLTCGHTFDGAEIGRIEIRCDCEGRAPWYFHIYGDDASTEQPPMIDALPSDQPKPAVIRSKTEKGKERGGQEVG